MERDSSGLSILSSKLEVLEAVVESKNISFIIGRQPSGRNAVLKQCLINW